MQGFESLQGRFVVRLFKNVVTQFIGLSLYHCQAGEVSRSNVVRGMKLLSTFQVLVITKRGEPDRLGSYKNAQD